MKIAVPVRETSQEKALKAVKRVKGKADLAEIWLDHIKDLDLKALVKNSPLPLICVCKKPIEGGRFKGNYKEARKLLLEAAGYGAKYIDLPLKGIRNQESGIRKHLADSRILNPDSRLIISYHNFKETPGSSELMNKVKEMIRYGADIVKIAVKANSLDDTLAVILLAQQLQAKKIPHILIAMGKKGVLSRVLTPYLGGEAMFAPLDKKSSSAPGQLTVSELKTAWGLISE